MPNEWPEQIKDWGYDKKKRAQLARNREALIKKNVGYVAPVPTDAFRKGWERIWGEKNVTQ